MVEKEVVKNHKTLQATDSFKCLEATKTNEGGIMELFAEIYPYLSLVMTK